MKQSSLRLAAVTAGATLFSFIFWNEKLALNALIYDLFLIPALFLFSPGSFRNKTVLLLLAGHLLCTADVIIHNTLLSKIAACFTLLVTTAFIQYRHRSPWYAGCTVLLKMLYGIPAVVKDLAASFSAPRQHKKMRLGKVIRFAFFPVLLAIVFLCIYTAANPAFSSLYFECIENVQAFFNRFFDINLDRILFFILGVYITGVLIEHADHQYYSSREHDKKDILIRQKFRVRRGFFFEFTHFVLGRSASGTLALKTQNTVGIISLALLNILLFIVNCVDVGNIWLRFGSRSGEPLWQIVHKGTELLIISIIAAMAILLFFFKGNLNFYKRNKWLKYGAYAWILQNTFLVLSVFLRDYTYIQYCGLAYKRIGVLFYLIMVLTGLVTMFIKIYRHKTTYYLMKVNAWAAIILLVLSCSVNWDHEIAAYNIAHRNTIELDVRFLFSLSDSTLPLLETYREEVLAKDGREPYETSFQERIRNFAIKQQGYTWLSWNYADDRTMAYLRNKHLVACR